MIVEVTKAETKSDALTEFLTFVLTILISTFLLRLVWNRSLVKHVTILKPINTMLDAFILSVGLSVVRHHLVELRHELAAAADEQAEHQQ